MDHQCSEKSTFKEVSQKFPIEVLYLKENMKVLSLSKNVNIRRQPVYIAVCLCERIKGER